MVGSLGPIPLTIEATVHSGLNGYIKIYNYTHLEIILDVKVFQILTM